MHFVPQSPSSPLPTVFLSVCEGAVFVEPCAVRTVLGSCVSVTFFVPGEGLAAIFHALLPREEEHKPDRTLGHAFRFVDRSIRTLLDELLARGANRRRIEAKVFGGASIMPGKGFDVGRRNIETAYDILSSSGLRVTASSVGGTLGRKLVFRTDTGEVFVKQIGRTVTG